MKLSRDLSNLVVFTNSVASQECLNEGAKKTLASSNIVPLQFQISFLETCLVRVCLQVRRATSCHSARPEPSRWSITERSTSWLSIRGSCHGFIPRHTASTRPISIPSSTGTSAVSWVSSSSAFLRIRRQ